MIRNQEITPQEVEQLLATSKNISIIDVREVEEIKQGKIPGAVNIPLGLIPFRLQDIDKSKEHILVCRSSARSGQATEFLSSYGYKVKNMIGGMMNWEGKVE